MFIGDSIVVEITRYQNICKKYFKSPETVNCGIHGDKTQHFLWRAKNLFIRPSVKFIVVHCGTNNLEYNNPINIAIGNS